MPTASEKKALGFLAAVAIAGAIVRMSGAVSDASAADSSSREALRRQIVAAESAGAVERRNRRQGGGSGVGSGLGSAASVTGRTKRRSPGRPVGPAPGAVAGQQLYPGASADPRDLFNPPAVDPPARRAQQPAVTSPVDVDRATASELEVLPRIGPALAKRIVADREANGPFGSIEGFQRVRGVGPAMAAALSGTVTFSGTLRPSIAGGVRFGGSKQAPGGAKRRRAPP